MAPPGEIAVRNYFLEQRGAITMHCTRKITDHIVWVGGSDRRLALFENLFPLPRGVAYNSYLILDDKTAAGGYGGCLHWAAVPGKHPARPEQAAALDYLVVNHMEPDHCASIEELMLRYPRT